MVDFLKVAVKEAYFIKDHPLLEFKQLVDSKTGELEPFMVAELNKLKFKLFDKSGLLIIQGSIHKFFNQGKHNYDDFSFSSLVFTLEYISHEFGVDLKFCKVQNIEFGVNILPKWEPKEILKSFLLHKNKAFEIGFDGHYKQVKHCEYIVKSYDKAFHYGLSTNVFRYELKFQKMRFLNRLGIFTLNDLTDSFWCTPILKKLVGEWRQILFFDITMEITPENEICLLKWQNPVYWLNLTPMQRLRQRKKLNELVYKDSEKVQGRIETLIFEKWNQLVKS